MKRQGIWQLALRSGRLVLVVTRLALCWPAIADHVAMAALQRNTTSHVLLRAAPAVHPPAAGAASSADFDLRPRKLN